MLHEQNAKQQKEFESLLEKNMKRLRDEYNRKIKENKEEQARLYDEREKDHISKKEALNAALKRKEDELIVAIKEGKSLTESVRKLEGERHALLVQLDDLEKEKVAEKTKLLNEIANRDKLIQIKKKEHQELVGRCQNLLDIKCALDNELSAYKMLLETEESR